MIGTFAARRALMLHGLGHDPVVGGHHQDDQVRDLGPAGPHEGESLVARGVQEHDAPLGYVHRVGPDVLGDPAELGIHDVGGADGIQQLGLAVVDVAHHRDDRRTGPQVSALSVSVA
jgi:hypothetical protein